ncbi:MAG: flagellar motor switch protein FliN [Planctomycetes bacterium]|nr:flagellar motor switch protein FliN [Planctomycetota bacterium]
MQAAIEEEQAAKAATAENASPVELPELAPDVDGAVGPNRMSMLNDVKLRVKIELGKTRMRIEDVLKLGDGSVVELDKLAGDPVDVFVNGRLIARGEVLVLNDNFCVRINEVMTADPHRVSA